MLHKICLLNGKHFLQHFWSRRSCKISQKILSMLQHKSQEINVIVHLQKHLNSLFLIPLFKCFHNLFPLFDKHQIRIVRIKLFFHRLLNFTLTISKGSALLDILEIRQRFCLLPWNCLVILNVVLNSFIFVVNTFLYFLHFLCISLFWVILALIKVLNWLDIVTSANSCIFM